MGGWVGILCVGVGLLVSGVSRFSGLWVSRFGSCCVTVLITLVGFDFDAYVSEMCFEVVGMGVMPGSDLLLFGLIAFVGRFDFGLQIALCCDLELWFIVWVVVLF